MNLKTTFILAAAFVGLILVYAFSGLGKAGRTTVTDAPAQRAPGDVAKSVWTDEPGEIIKIVCRRKDADTDWVFEKEQKEGDTGQNEWRMTSPFDADAVPWDVDRIGRQLTGLNHDISFKIGDEGSLTLAEAGLEPPLVKVTLVDENDKTVRVDIGNPASSSTTYVRVDEGALIYVAKADLKKLIKDKALDYREKALWSFDEPNVTGVEIVQRNEDGETKYVLARSGGNWMFQSPVTAKATSKVNDMLTGMKNLRVTDWVEDRAGRLPAYGLDPAPVTVSVTVTEEIEVEDESEEDAAESESEETDDGEADEAPEKKTELQTETYVLHLSDRSPIGQETKAYVSVGSDPTVGTIMKTAADKFHPVMKEWREMRLTTVAVPAATRIELVTAGGSTKLTKDGGRWTFDEGPATPADGAQVSAWLQALGNLEAVAFIDGKVEDPAAYGLDDPKADIRVKIPGAEDVERIAIGGYTDPQSKRLMYVRRSEVASVAKVRAADAESLIRSPLAFHDRTVISVPADRIQSLVLDVENRMAEGRTSVTLARTGEEWTMSSPIQAKARSAEVDKLVQALSVLRAEAVVGSGDTASAFGLHEPQATVVLSYQAVVSPAAEEPSPNETMTLAVTEHDGKIYAKRDGVDTVYEVDRAIYDLIVGEYRDGKVISFDDEKVTAFTVRRGDDAYTFGRADGKWVYQAEPDLPLDQTKVANILTQLHDIRTDRFVVHEAGELANYGLGAPSQEVTVELSDAPPVMLSVSQNRCTKDPQGRHYAAVSGVSGVSGVFLVPPDTENRLRISLDDLEAK